MAAALETLLRPVAFVRTPFAEKFGVPRQSGLVPAAEGRVEFLPEFAAPEFMRGLEAFSHVWLVTGFHKNPPWSGSAVVRPPRLGGNEKVGVFASRAPNRPNGLGLSLVKIVAIEPGVLRVAGIDCVDGTPVYDVKPYLPWCEALPEARADWANSPPPISEATQVIIAAEFAELLGEETTQLLREVLRLELAPAYVDLEKQPRDYGLAIAGWNVRWRMGEGGVREVLEIRKI
ncbi:tRNA (N6-threonylcarbamoyladenosine(37)-N6)-methyltransferase TrmO [Nibricoccus aquaticus]|uniref:tRNA (N6-threonylcarbamoyladenosine(37)-N6)-methyltransferase TrmO n=1 Tax=Nibricoccus aquaticus TaxID=2576891 RepID=A0A290Q2G2_9BACT|nr:tRNA (N6-threonylcarbamoyladenosine(37)-N6)-methyltransferase TrmO [Nibricoccus aquaticus]ATC62603.1 tRNA (N6-threonylcarbamoyladenosine(37)-N6)-methyltransferase TrmO [Nibricoccus aquaticus]